MKETVRKSNFSLKFFAVLSILLIFTACTKGEQKQGIKSVNSLERAEKYLTSFDFNSFGLDYIKPKYSFAIKYPDKTDFGKNFTASFVLQSVSNDSKEFADKLKNFLLKQRTKNGRWSFDSHGISTDSDTTLTVLLALFEKEFIGKKKIEETVVTLRRYYLRKCGLASLNNNIKHSNFSAHFEPTANYITLMSRLKSETDDLNCFVERILETQKKNGSFSAYWYPSESYASFLGLRALSSYTSAFSLKKEESAKIKAAIKTEIEFLKKTQNNDGSWGKGEAKPMETAFALLALNEVKNRQNLKKALKKGLKYLKNSQNDDGSWDGTIFFNYYYTQCGKRSCPEKWHDRKRKLISTSAALRALKVNAL